MHCSGLSDLAPGKSFLSLAFVGTYLMAWVRSGRLALEQVVSEVCVP